MKSYRLSSITESTAINILFVFAAIFLVVLSQSCSQQDAKANKKAPSEKALPVKTAIIRSAEMAVPIRISGTVSPIHESRLSFKTGGIIKTINVDEGDRVKAGAVLATLNLEEIQAQVAQARLSFEKSQRDYDRAEALYRDTVGTLESLQNATTDLDIAKANIVMVEHNLKFSTITAPTDGIILQKFVEENELASPGAPIVHFASTNTQWILKVGLTDKDIVRVQLGDPANISMDAWPTKQLEGTISQIGDAPDAMTGLYTIEIIIQTKNLAIKPGFFARAEIIPSQKETYTLIPISALQEGIGDQVDIYTVKDNNKLHKESVRVDKILNDELALLNRADLVGKKVVVEQSKDLRNNQTIKILK